MTTTNMFVKAAPLILAAIAGGFYFFSRHNQKPLVPEPVHVLTPQVLKPVPKSQVLTAMLKLKTQVPEPVVKPQVPEPVLNLLEYCAHKLPMNAPETFGDSTQERCYNLMKWLREPEVMDLEPVPVSYPKTNHVGNVSRILKLTRTNVERVLSISTLFELEKQLHGNIAPDFGDFSPRSCDDIQDSGATNWIRRVGTDFERDPLFQGTRVHLAYAVINPTKENARLNNELRYKPANIDEFASSCPPVAAIIQSIADPSLPLSVKRDYKRDHVYIQDGCHRTQRAINQEMPLLAALLFVNRTPDVASDECELVIHQWQLKKHQQKRKLDSDSELDVTKFIKYFQFEWEQCQNKSPITRTLRRRFVTFMESFINPESLLIEGDKEFERLYNEMRNHSALKALDLPDVSAVFPFFKREAKRFRLGRKGFYSSVEAFASVYDDSNPELQGLYAKNPDPKTRETILQGLYARHPDLPKFQALFRNIIPDEQ